MPRIFDAHTHAHFAAFKNDWKEVIERALADDIGVINVGTQKDTSQKAIKVAEAFENDVYAIVGLHPIHTTKSFHDKQELGGDTAFSSRGEDFDYDYYKKLAEHPKVVAIGECGLDYYRHSPQTSESSAVAKAMADRQEKAFRAQIKLAEELKMPLMIHCRASKGSDDAYERMLEIVNEENVSVPMISHFYAGSPEMTKKLIARGFYFTFGGVITFVRDYDKTIDLIPLERIMLETDAPYVTPAPHRGKRNEPAYVKYVAEKMAELKGVDYDTICTITTDTVKNVFKI